MMKDSIENDNIWKKNTAWQIIIIVGIYIAFQLIADVAAAKLVQIWKWSLPAGTFVFAITFTWRDLMHRRLGKKATYAVIFTAAIANILMVVYFLFTFILPSANYWTLQEAYVSVLGFVPRITAGSIIAELVSQAVDTEVYSFLDKRNVKPAFKVLITNAFSLPVDSAVFAAISFLGVLPFSAIVDLMIGQIVFKAAVTVLSVPIIYLWRRK